MTYSIIGILALILLESNGLTAACYVDTVIHTLRVTARSEGTVKIRHLTIGLFGIAMVVLIAVQVVLTTHAFLRDGLYAGHLCSAHLSKPVEPEALFETLESLIL